MRMPGLLPAFDEGRGHRVRFHGSLAWLAPVVALASVGLVACLPVPPDRPWPANQSFPGPACLDDPGTVNRVACENTATGNPASEWDVVGSGDASIQGFATAISANRGETVHFKVKTDARLYHLEIYRMGYYGGAGARKVAIVRPSAALPQSQPACGFDASVNLLDCGNWTESATWAVPADAASGIYFAKLVRDSGAIGASHVFFVVRDDASSSQVLYQTSDTTWQAYNTYGGYSLYGPKINSVNAKKVSYNRPFVTRSVNGGQSWVFSAEYPMVRWLEANGHDTSYFTGVDADLNGALLQQHQVFMSSGHDEYWSGNQRANVEAAVASGVNLAFFSGNEVFWKTRWENNDRTLVCYKESTQKLDPTPVWTGLWRDPHFSPPSDGGRPENALTGTLYGVETTGSITVPNDDGQMRLWRNTSIAQLAPGATATLPSGTLGYEWNTAVDDGAGGTDALFGVTPTGNQFRPAGLIPLSTTTVNLQASQAQTSATEAPDEGAPSPNPSALASLPTTATHHLTLYRANSGALVFDTGTVQWSWGLDANHDGTPTTADPRMQQATVNLFADMGVQPATLQAGLVTAQASTDTTPPSSAVTAPTAGTTTQVNQGVMVQGSANDADGHVGGVDVSTDNGQTWNPANGRDNWLFGWTPTQPGTYTIRSRAADDSANLEQPGPGITVTVTA
jgi:hypothetical protein